MILRIGIVAAALLGLEAAPAGAQPERGPTVRWVIDDSVFDLTYWQSVQNSRDPQDLRSYLDQFPDGRFAALARNRLRALPDAEPPVEPVELGSPTPSAPVMNPVSDPAASTSPRAPSRVGYDGVWRGRSGPWVFDLTVRGDEVDGTLRCGNNIYRLRERLDAGRNLAGSASRMIGGGGFPLSFAVGGAFPGLTLALSGMPGGCVNGGRGMLSRTGAG